MQSEKPTPDDTTLLLQQWHAGRSEALQTIVTRHLPFLRGYVQRNAKPGLLAKLEVEDLVQETAIQILSFSPSFVVNDGQHFRRLLARMVLNSMSEKWKYLTAMRRDMHREAPIPSDSVLQLDPGEDSVVRPSAVAAQQEEEAWVRLGLEMLHDQDRVVILMRDWQARSFTEIGAELDLQPNAARMRYCRAMDKLGDVIAQLRAGGVPEPSDG